MRDIRFKIQHIISSIKDLQDDHPEKSKTELNEFIERNNYHVISGFAKSLQLVDNYIVILKKTNELEYLKIIENIREKVNNLSIKKSDLKDIKYKI